MPAAEPVENGPDGPAADTNQPPVAAVDDADIGLQRIPAGSPWPFGRPDAAEGPAETQTIGEKVESMKMKQPRIRDRSKKPAKAV